MKKQTFTTKTEKDRAHLLAFARRVPLDKPIVWTVEELKKKRSLSQNALYQKWAEIIADHTGHSHDEIKDILKRKFLTPKVVEINGVKYEIYTTTTLSTGEMAKYMKKIDAFAATDLGLYLPHPEDQHMRNAG